MALALGRAALDEGLPLPASVRRPRSTRRGSAAGWWRRPSESSFDIQKKAWSSRRLRCVDSRMAAEAFVYSPFLSRFACAASIMFMSCSRPWIERPSENELRQYEYVWPRKKVTMNVVSDITNPQHTLIDDSRCTTRWVPSGAEKSGQSLAPVCHSSQRIPAQHAHAHVTIPSTNRHTASKTVPRHCAHSHDGRSSNCRMIGVETEVAHTRFAASSYAAESSSGLSTPSLFTS